MDYSINYNDERFKQVENEKQTAVNNLNNQYNNMINQSQEYYDKQIQAADDYAQKQSELINQQTEYEENINKQNKEKTQREYEKEQRGSYSDYVKELQSAGAQNAQLGLTNSGYNESNRAALYSAYQGRIATAKQTMTDAITQYDNQMAQIRLQNNSKLAEIAYKALQTKLELSLQGFQYKNQLVTEQMDKQMQYDQYYYGKYQDVLNQINKDNALAEEVKQFNEKMNEERRQYNTNLEFQKQKAAQEQSNWEKEYALAKQKAAQEQIQTTPNPTKTNENEIVPGQNGVPSDFYFDNKNGAPYQPKYQYTNGEWVKLEKTGDLAGSIPNTSISDLGKDKNIWKNKVNGQYYVWDGTIKDDGSRVGYVPITDEYLAFKEAQKSLNNKNKNNSSTSSKISNTSTTSSVWNGSTGNVNVTSTNKNVWDGSVRR